METYQIEVLEPKAKKLLKDLEDLKLIKIRKKVDAEQLFFKTVKKIRNVKGRKPSEKEIQAAVEEVRSEMYNEK